MAQISRKELKSDEFVSGMDAAFEFYLQHQQRILTIAVIAVVVGLAGWGYYSWQSSRNRAAMGMLAQGLNTLHEPLLGASTVPGTPAFASVQTRAQAAAQQFQAVVSQYPSTSAGQMARYYLGLAQVDLKDANAQKTLETAADSGDNTVSVAAKNALANLDIELNQPDKAHALLLDLSHQDSAALPKAVAVMELADLDRTFNPKEAASYYQQLEKDYPASQTAQTAQQQLASLKQ